MVDFRYSCCTYIKDKQEANNNMEPLRSVEESVTARLGQTSNTVINAKRSVEEVEYIRHGRQLREDKGKDKDKHSRQY